MRLDSGSINFSPNTPAWYAARRIEMFNFDCNPRRSTMDNNGIHPPPAEFTAEEIKTDEIVQWFHYAHLPPVLQELSRPFCEHARRIVDTIPRSAERTAGLRKLLEAKDCIVRAGKPR